MPGGVIAAQTERLVREAIEYHMNFTPATALITSVLLSLLMAFISGRAKWLFRGCAHSTTYSVVDQRYVPDATHITVRILRREGDLVYHACHVYLSPDSRALTAGSSVRMVTWNARRGRQLA